MVRLRPILAGCAVGCALLIASAQASTSPPTQSAAMQQLAADAAYCQSWHNRLTAEISDFRVRCSGSLDPQTYASCQQRNRHLDDEIAQFNSQCG